MPIKYIEGDLLSSKEDVIIHGCNNQGKFGSGFAKVVRKKHPKAAKDYDRQFNDGGLILGSVIWSFDERLIGHAIVQPTYGKIGTGRHLSYTALESAFTAVRDCAINGIPVPNFSRGFKSISMPLIGSSLGGGDWAEIEKIIQKTLGDFDVCVYALPGNKPSAKDLNTKFK